MEAARAVPRPRRRAVHAPLVRTGVIVSAPSATSQPELPRQDRRAGPQDRRRRRARGDHVDPRHHRRQHRPADLPDRVRREPGEGLGLLHRGVDGHGLHPRARDGHPADRLGGRPLRHEAALHPRRRPLHGRLGPVRDRRVDRDAHRLPRPAGPGRRHAHAARHDDHDPGRRAGPDGPAHGDPRRARCCSARSSGRSSAAG